MNSIPASGFASQPNRKALIPVFMVVAFLYWLGLYLYMPTLPIYLQTKTSDLALIGTALSMYGLWQLIIRLPLGIFADWAGRRKPFILVWLGLVALGDWILGSAGNIGTAAFGRALIGVAAGTWVPLIVLFSSLFEPGEVIRATAILAMVGSAGRIVATAANGWLNELGGYSLAFNLAAGCALAGLLVMAFLPDHRTAPRKPSLMDLKSLLRRKDVMVPSALQILTHVADFAATFTFMPILARSMGASDVMLSTMLSLDLAVSLVGNSISAGLTRHFGQKWMLAISFVLLGFGVGGVVLAQNLAMVFAFQMCIGMGFGIAYPLLMGLSINQVEAGHRTTAMGLHQSIYSLGMFLGPWLSGMLASAFGIHPMFILIGAGVFILGLAGSVFFGGEAHASEQATPEVPTLE
jgi:DHA1 family multidrug resistance protein-like MFS transporter